MQLRLAQERLTALEASLPGEVAAAQTALAEARVRCEAEEAAVRCVCAVSVGYWLI